MDPDANLREQRIHFRKILRLLAEQARARSPKRIVEITEEIAGAAGELAELMDALDHWICVGGGPLPKEWIR